LPSEHGACPTLEECESKKSETGITSLFTGKKAEKKTQQKNQHQQPKQKQKGNQKRASEKPRKKGETIRASKPLISSLPPGNVFFPALPSCHVRHVNIFISLLGRVSHIWQESSPFELVCALPCLPPLCTVIHVCINIGVNILILAPECMYEANDVHYQTLCLQS